MRATTLLRQSLRHYWRTNLAVVAGVAITVAVLAGALLVGDSVRASLRDLVLLRLGSTAYVIASNNFFREELADDLQSNPRFSERFGAAAPLSALEGIVTHEASRRRASGIPIYGVDERFWKFHGREVTGGSPQDREALLSPSLAAELEAEAGDSLRVRVEKPTDIPVDSLHGRKSDLGRTIRLTVRRTLPTAELGEFSLRPHQGAVRAVFLPLQRLQRELGQKNKVNSLLVSETKPAADGRATELEQHLKEVISLEDLGLRLHVLEEPRALSLESEKILIEDRLAEVVQATAIEAGLQTTSVFTYLANSIRIGDREIPYSLVTAIDPVPEGEQAQSSTAAHPSIWLNSWAYRDLNARPGKVATLDYYVWEDGGRLQIETAQFEVRGALPMEGIGADAQLAPQYPGITDSKSVSDWDPPFPIDLGRIRPRDEEYWDLYRAAPKAFVPLQAGQELWRSRFGRLTALRFTPRGNLDLPEVLNTYRRNLTAALDPVQAGFTVVPVRTEGAGASRGAVNFGEYFFYFSFFLVVSALLLTGLFFRLGVEQRLREIGLLRAVGFPPERIGKLFLLEGLVLAVFGSLAGLVGAVAYGWLIMFGLRTWWVDAVGTTFLDLHVSPGSLLLGGLGGILAGAIWIAWTLQGLRPATPRSLLAGSWQASGETRAETRNAFSFGIGSAGLGLFLLVGAWFDWIGQVAGFFGSGTLLLLALVCFQWVWLARRRRDVLAGKGLRSLARMGFRNATWRPGRSLLSIALIASATFIIVAVDAFRREGPVAWSDPKSGTGGFPLLAEAVLPIPQDLNSPGARQELPLSDENLSALENVKFVSFRLRSGEDASCLNLYQPQNPRILGAPADFLAGSRFSFQDSLARTSEEKQNPWRLLEATGTDGAIPAVADANSMTYVLHRRLGEEFVLNQTNGPPVRLRLVAALSDSIFQSELLISEKHFLRAFPQQQGFRFFLVDAPADQISATTEILEEGLSDSGLDVESTAERVATFHRVENTYLSTFQTLGGLGLLLGTGGLAAVLLRNVMERRRELALLRAVGFRPAHLAYLVVAEHALLLGGGLASGILSALLAIAPALASRGGALPLTSLGALLLAVLLTGLAASVLAVAAVVRAPLLPALRTE